MRAACACPLLKTVELSGGRHLLYPFMTYYYLGLEVSLQSFVNRVGFLEKCEEWRNLQQRDGIYSDVYDGKIWKDFQVYRGVPFLQTPNNFVLMMNFDFFQPYKHVQYSVGAMYLTILNLPRCLRYKQENVILCGLIPGPQEPEQHINTYLEPLVDELLKFWEGVELTVSEDEKKKFRAALLCVVCDIPACRKVCGFLSYTAHLGCSKCFKRFSGGFGALDYSGFDRHNWPPRTGTEHKRTSLSLLNATTLSELEKKESESGCRYSVLVKLPYFDAPRMAIVVDPMHNLFLGSAKYFLKNVWIDKGIIAESSFSEIQQRVNSIKVPTGMGRIPHKIRSGFSAFTADQWKNWVLYFSLLALQDIITGEDLECWRHFVLACRQLCCKQLTQSNIQLGDALLMQFCRRIERLYGKEIVNPNMHLHGHLRSCIEDYGPLHGFWLYAFECYNGILGSAPNNNRLIEVQLMDHFVHDSSVMAEQLPVEFREDFERHFSSISRSSRFAGSVADTVAPIRDEADNSTQWTIPRHVQLPSSRSRFILDDVQCQKLLHLYSNLYATSSTNIDVPGFCWKYQSLHLQGKLLGSHRSRSEASSLVFVTWNCRFFGPVPIIPVADNEVKRPARINSFLLHRISVGGTSLNHILVSLSWFQFHPQKRLFW